MVVAKDVERQITVVIVEAVEEASFLPAMDRKVRCVKIQHNLIRRFTIGLQKHIDQQSIDSLGITQDLLVSVFFLGG